MAWVVTAVALFVILFGFVIAFGAPYLPTLKNQTDAALDLLALKKGQTLLELGSGDGRVLKAAAKRGLNAVGYELNPILVIIAYIVTWKYRKQIRIIWGNYWVKDWPEANGVYVFLLDRYMQKLSNKIIHEFHAPVKLVSFAFKVPGKTADKQKRGLFLYQY